MLRFFSYMGKLIKKLVNITFISTKYKLYDTLYINYYLHKEYIDIYFLSEPNYIQSTRIQSSLLLPVFCLTF